MFSKDIPVLSYASVQALRDKDKDIINPNRIIAQAGAQERILHKKRQFLHINIKGKQGRKLERKKH